MAIEFEVQAEFPVAPEVIYNAWLESEAHSAMTGSPAVVSSIPGMEFNAWDGYIQGANLVLEPHRRILQRWRTTEFNSGEKDSRLEIILDEIAGGTRLTLRHSDLPPHGMQYQQGWIDSYFIPMKAYFESKDR